MVSRFNFILYFIYMLMLLIVLLSYVNNDNSWGKFFEQIFDQIC